VYVASAFPIGIATGEGAHSIDDTLRPWCAFDLSFVHASAGRRGEADDRYVTPSGAGIKTGETTQTILSLCLLCSFCISSASPSSAGVPASPVNNFLTCVGTEGPKGERTH